MTPVIWMTAGSLLSAVVAVSIVGWRPGLEVLLGMAGPLIVSSGSWVIAERVYRRAPEQLTAVMATGFAGKMVFFGVYVVLVITAPTVRPVPFVVSFTSYFIALHLAEAFCLKRLFAGDSRGSR